MYIKLCHVAFEEINVNAASFSLLNVQTIVQLIFNLKKILGLNIFGQFECLVKFCKLWLVIGICWSEISEYQRTLQLKVPTYCIQKCQYIVWSIDHDQNTVSFECGHFCCMCIFYNTEKVSLRSRMPQLQHFTYWSLLHGQPYHE